jgi:hypothetical protein
MLFYRKSSHDYLANMQVRNLLPCILIVAMLLASLQFDKADSQYYIGLMGERWSGHGGPITVRIDSQNSTLLELTSEALKTWNQAMQWYHDNYAPNSDLYQFATGGAGSVKISFGMVWTCPSTQSSGFCFPLPCFECTGVADIRYNYRDWIQSVDITIATSAYYIPLDRATIFQTLMHELGHALGLDHTLLTQDLMYQYVDVGQVAASSVFPSTLDLLAVTALADANTMWGLTKVSLPSNIPYQDFPVKRQLHVMFPSQLGLTIDGTSYSSGQVTTNLAAGVHTIAIEPISIIDNGSRIAFAHWTASDGSMTGSPSITLELIEDTTLQATYKTQYRLVVRNTLGKVVSDDWYDSGARSRTPIDSEADHDHEWRTRSVGCQVATSGLG